MIFFNISHNCFKVNLLPDNSNYQFLKSRNFQSNFLNRIHEYSNSHVFIIFFLPLCTGVFSESCTLSKSNEYNEFSFFLIAIARILCYLPAAVMWHRHIPPPQFVELLMITCDVSIQFSGADHHHLTLKHYCGWFHITTKSSVFYWKFSYHRVMDRVYLISITWLLLE